MNVSVVIPWRDGCPWRARALDWVWARYTAEHPDWQLVLGASPEGPFSRTQAILDGATKADGTVVVVADGDVWCDPAEAVDHVATAGWAIPHKLIHRLSNESTAQVIAGASWRGLPLSADNPQDRKPYKGHAAGTLVVFRRDVLDDVPPDPRFVGWGQEDDAWAAALRTLVGRPWRGDLDLVHLWHPPQPRKSRATGNDANQALWRRYRRHHGRPGPMRALIDEAKEATWACSSS